MGRHSRTPRATTLLEKYLVNLTLVIAATLAFSLVIYLTIASVAQIKANEVPDPIATGTEYGQDPYGMGGMPGAGAQGVRYCPATGCAATTCHAETGEPPPGM